MDKRSDAEESAIWQALSVAWLMGSLVAWATAAISEPNSFVAGSALTAIALLVFGISAVLRLPVLDENRQISTLAAHVIWLLCMAASLNWLGYCLLRAAQPMDALPAMFLWCLFEGWLFNRMRLSQRLPWARECLFEAQRQVLSLFVPASEETRNSIATDAVDSQSMGSALIENDGEIAEAEGLPFEDGVMRRTVDGVDEQGRRYISGEARVEFEPEQATQTVVISFCPVLLEEPSIELETLDVVAPGDREPDDEIATRIVNWTPAGARISLRRGKPRRHRSVILMWYAHESSEDETAAKVTREARMPQPLP